MKSLLLVLLLAVAATAQPQVNYPLGPDSQPQAGVPKGTVTKLKLEPGRIYPGTPHDYAIYVPAQYDANKPTPFMIFLDGSGALGDGVRVPVVFDNLIAKGDLPPLIGIFVDPGVLPVASEVTQMNRFNRINEYDSLDDRYSRFLIEELIPEVAKKYNLSKDPNDRALYGVSTGATGAFMAAWHRPDQFRRVMTFIGSFVNFRGADSLPARIRRSEPRPIRIFMQDGKNDLNSYAGKWIQQNESMAAALEFMGYDVKLVVGEEGHNMRHGGAVMPEALRWLWREYPKPIEVREPPVPTFPRPPQAANANPNAPRPQMPPGGIRGAVYAIVSLDKPWQQVGETYKSVASPAADKDGNVYFADPASNRIYKSDANGKVTLFKENTNGATALRVGADGRLYASQLARKRIVSYGASGDEKAVASNVEANDLALSAKGEIYFVDTAHRTINLLDSKGKSRVVSNCENILKPTAITLSPDQSLLNVADGNTKFTWNYQVAPDGSLVNGEPFHRLEMPEMSWMSGVEGLTVDSIGHLYATSALGIQVCEQIGRCAQLLNKPEAGTTPIANIAFGGPARDWLYVTQGTKLFRRQVKRTGVTAWEPVKPPRPGL
ncbi:MAG: SMP-30/gluconolactonase/LRE family protein [Acidobacteria bacterium]|nr:SMP-30/gluconolactonase/LRE family protein [Acidobacteriota bacterium]